MMKNLLKRKQILILCLLAFSFMCSQLYSQGTKYTIVFVNNSLNVGDACVFQQDPDLGVPNVFSLAWLVKESHPTETVVFNWEIEYDFVWGVTGKLRPGIIFTAGQVLPANLSTTNMVTLAYNSGAYTFENQTEGPCAGALYIKQYVSIPLMQVSVGIGMSGFGTFVVQVQPNWIWVLTPHPRYWIAFGDFTQGQVLDTTIIGFGYPVEFPPGVYSMTAILNKDNTWIIKPTSQVNADFVKAKKRNKKARWGKY